MENTQSKVVESIIATPLECKTYDEFNKRIREHIQETEQKLRRYEFQKIEKTSNSYEESVLFRTVQN